MNKIAARFLTRCFSSNETIALLIRKENDRGPTQRVVSLEAALKPRYLAWLQYENADGANIYVTANPLRAGSRRRTKESIASVRHLYIDIDTDGDARLAALRASNAVPTPSAIISTSAGKYQVLWRVDGFDFARQEQTLKLLAIAFGGDPACTDCNRVLRVPGFFNCKYDPASGCSRNGMLAMVRGPLPSGPRSDRVGYFLPLCQPSGRPCAPCRVCGLIGWYCVC